GGEERGLVEDVGEVGAGAAGGAFGDHVQVDVLGHRLALGVDLEDRLPPPQVGGLDGDLAVETPRTQQRGVEDVGAVGRGDHDDVRRRVEPVHLHEHLVERLLAFVVPAAQACSTVAPDGVDLVDGDDRRGIGFGLFEQVTDPGGTPPDEHFHEVRTGDGVEGDLRLPGYRPGEEGLPRS